MIEVNVKLKSCPLGFTLGAAGSCACSDFIEVIVKRQITCHIENNTFSKPGDLNVWIDKQ